MSGSMIQGNVPGGNDNTPPVIPVSGGTPTIPGGNAPLDPQTAGILSTLLHDTYDLSNSLSSDSTDGDVEDDSTIAPDSQDLVVTNQDSEEESNGEGNEQSTQDDTAPQEPTNTQGNAPPSTMSYSMIGGPGAAMYEALSSAISSLTAAQNDLTLQKMFSSQEMYQDAQGQYNAQLQAASAGAQQSRLQGYSYFTNAGSTLAGVGLGSWGQQSTKEAEDAQQTALTQKEGTLQTTKMLSNNNTGVYGLDKKTTTNLVPKPPVYEPIPPEFSSRTFETESRDSDLESRDSTSTTSSYTPPLNPNLGPPKTEIEMKDLSSISTTNRDSIDSTNSDDSSIRSSTTSTVSTSSTRTDVEDKDIQHLTKYGVLPTRNSDSTLRDYTEEGGEEAYTKSLVEKMNPTETKSYESQSGRVNMLQEHFKNHDCLPPFGVEPEDREYMTGICMDRTCKTPEERTDCTQRMADTEHLTKFGTLPSRNIDGSPRTYTPDETAYQKTLEGKMIPVQQSQYTQSQAKYTYQKEYLQENGHLPTHDEEGKPITYSEGEQQYLTRNMIDKMSPDEKSALEGKMPSYTDAAETKVKTASDRLSNISRSNEMTYSFRNSLCQAVGNIGNGVIMQLIAVQKEQEGKFQADATMFKTSFDMVSQIFSSLQQQSNSLASEMLQAISSASSAMSAQRN